MADGFNKVILIGNLGSDPQLRYTANGRAILKFSLATNESWKSKEGERQSRTDWHHVVVWGPRAEALNKFLGKGRRIGVEGRIRSSKYEDKDGKTRTWIDIEAAEVLLLDGGRPALATAPEPPEEEAYAATGTDDIQF